MSVEEMKSEAVKKLNQLQSKEAIKEILKHLETLHEATESQKLSAENVFKEAQKKYDNLLKRLA